MRTMLPVVILGMASWASPAFAAIYTYSAYDNSPEAEQERKDIREGRDPCLDRCSRTCVTYLRNRGVLSEARVNMQCEADGYPVAASAASAARARQPVPRRGE